MVTLIRRDAGLGDPPKENTNNDVETGNFMIKYALEFDAKKPHKFIVSVRDLICLQYRNEERAILEKVPYRNSKFQSQNGLPSPISSECLCLENSKMLA